MRRIGIAAAVLSCAALLTACGGGQTQSQANKGAGGAPGNQGEVTVKSLDAMKFEPPNVTLRVNAPARVTLDNSGSALVHDWVVDNLGGQKIQIKAEPRQKASSEFTPATAGTYQIYCAEPGHKEAGMTGTLTVN